MGIREKKGKNYNGGTANNNVDVERKFKKQGHYRSTRNNSKKKTTAKGIQVGIERKLLK